MNSEIVPEQYRSLIKQLLANAHELLLAGQRIPSAYYLGNTATGSLHQIPVDTSGQPGKEASALHARRVAVFLDADFAVLVTEAWTLAADKTEQAQSILAKYGSIGQYPGKLDVAWFQLETRHGFFNAQAEILRVPPSTKRRKLGPIKWLLADSAQGTLAQVLPKLPA